MMKVEIKSDGSVSHWAAENGHKSVVQLLLQKGADVAAKDNIGRTALHRTAERGQ